MGEFEELLGTTGVEQWVRNKFVRALSEFKKDNSDWDIDKFIADFNRQLLADFTIEARKAVDKTISRATDLLESTKLESEHEASQKASNV